MDDIRKIDDTEKLIKGFNEEILNNEDIIKNLKEDTIKINEQLKSLIDIFLSNQYNSNDEVENILKEINAYKHKNKFSYRLFM